MAASQSTKPSRKALFPLFRLEPDGRPLDFLTPYPRRLRLGRNQVDLFERRAFVEATRDARAAADGLVTDLKAVANIPAVRSADGDYPIRLNIENGDLAAEGYRLEITHEAITLAGQDAAGLYYGVQTLLQLAAFGQGIVPTLRIEDWPHYPIRAAMLDMGRSIYTVPLIKRVIRMMARLKLNTLHLHLYDDQLMGLRFKRLPLGKENPGAITLSDLAGIVRYAKQYHINVCPELESWGHVASVIYHFPECYGDRGMHGEGASLGIGPKSYALLQNIYDEVVAVLADESMVHLGLDEARWKVLPGVRNPEKYNPQRFVGDLYDLLMKAGKRHGKRLTMQIWADHGGRPIPSELQDKIIIQPWNYFEYDRKTIRKQIRKYGGEGKPPFMMGAGASSMHNRGTFGATRHWCEAGRTMPNCRGVTLCMWENNFIDQHVLTLFGGASPAWNPFQLELPPAYDAFGEYLTGTVSRRVRSWQTLYPDANPDAILRDRGPAVYRGYYVSGDRIGEPVAPTVMKATRQ